MNDIGALVGIGIGVAASADRGFDRATRRLPQQLRRGAQIVDAFENAYGRREIVNNRWDTQVYRSRTQLERERYRYEGSQGFDDRGDRRPSSFDGGSRGRYNGPTDNLGRPVGDNSRGGRGGPRQGYVAPGQDAAVDPEGATEAFVRAMHVAADPSIARQAGKSYAEIRRDALVEAREILDDPKAGLKYADGSVHFPTMVVRTGPRTGANFGMVGGRDYRNYPNVDAAMAQLATRMREDNIGIITQADLAAARPAAEPAGITVPAGTPAPDAAARDGAAATGAAATRAAATGAGRGTGAAAPGDTITGSEGTDRLGGASNADTLATGGAARTAAATFNLPPASGKAAQIYTVNKAGRTMKAEDAPKLAANQVEDIQRELGVKPVDGKWGPDTQAAFAKVAAAMNPPVNPRDVDFTNPNDPETKRIITQFNAPAAGAAAPAPAAGAAAPATGAIVAGGDPAPRAGANAPASGATVTGGAPTAGATVTGAAPVDQAARMTAAVDALRQLDTGTYVNGKRTSDTPDGHVGGKELEPLSITDVDGKYTKGSSKPALDKLQAFARATDLNGDGINTRQEVNAVAAAAAAQGLTVNAEALSSLVITKQMVKYDLTREDEVRAAALEAAKARTAGAPAAGVAGAPADPAAPAGAPEAGSNGLKPATQKTPSELFAARGFAPEAKEAILAGAGFKDVVRDGKLSEAEKAMGGMLEVAAGTVSKVDDRAAVGQILNAGQAALTGGTTLAAKAEAGQVYNPTSHEFTAAPPTPDARTAGQKGQGKQ